jgi:ABC-2 type transport system permease protein
MTTLALTVRDSRTMVRRNLKHAVRYPVLTLLVAAVPIIFLLLFVYVLGGTLGAGLGGIEAGRADYVNYVVPGVLVLAIASGAQGTAISVAMDMTEGIVARFRTMAIARGAVLTGHVAGALVQTLIAAGAVVVVAVAIGFRPNATALEWLALVGVVLLVGLALTWITVALGIRSKTVEGASNVPMPLLILPFLGSGFVPTDTMPGPVRWFAEHQPFTPFVDTMRGLLLGDAIGGAAVATLAWSVGLSLLGYLAARSAYERRSVG